jgi:ferrochelatase
MEGPALLLMDYGAPGDDDQVRPFIADLLSDPAILPMPWGLRQGLARGIARRRAPKVIERYRAIGGSPLPAAVQRLSEALGGRMGEPFTVRPAYCYAAPRVAEVVDELAERGIRRVVGVPLFPQRSTVTSDVCQRMLLEAATRRGLSATLCGDFHQAPGFLQALADGLVPLLSDDSHVLMVAHGLPRRLEQAGDPYPGLVRETARALAARLPGDPAWSLAFQSRLGPAAWTGPYLEDELARLAGEGVRDLVLQPISFVCENLETRWDLDHAARERAAELGIARVARAPAPAGRPGLLDALEAHVRAVVMGSGWCPFERGVE